MKKNIRLIDCETEKKQLIDQFINPVDIELVDYLTDRKYARNSLLAMTKDWNLFVQFCQLKHVTALPASATALRLFIERESKQRKYATIKRYVITIGLFHRILRLPDPSATTAVKVAVSKLRLDKHGDAKPTQAFEEQHLHELSERLSHSDHPRDIRNLALYFVMFHCLAKRGELRDMTVDQVVETSAGNLSVIIKENRYQLEGLGSELLRKWLSIRSSSSRWLFSSIDKHGNIGSDKLNDSSIYRIVRGASELLGLSVQFSGQSLRVGAAKQLAKEGMKVKDIQRVGRWMSAAMPYHYLGNRSLADAERMVFKTFKPIS